MSQNSPDRDPAASPEEPSLTLDAKERKKWKKRQMTSEETDGNLDEKIQKPDSFEGSKVK